MLRLKYAYIFFVFLFSCSYGAATPYFQEYDMIEKNAFALLPEGFREWLELQTIPICRLETKSSDYAAEELMEEQFKTLKKLEKYVRLPAKEGAQKEHIYKNRKKYRVAYDETRTLRHIHGFYYNANNIVTPNYKYVVCEAPLDHTVDDFWRMVIQSDVRVIISLVTPFEHGKYNITQFWSSQSHPHTIDNAWKITCKEERIIAQKNVKGAKPQKIICRTLSCIPVLHSQECTHLEDERVIVQLHYWNWPDKSVPDTQLFLKLIQETNQQLKSFKQHHPILVHCAAGIGRSGTFVAAHSLENELLSERKAGSGIYRSNILKRILGLRRQRHKMVSNHKQYESIIKVLSESLNAHYSDKE